LLFRMDEGGGEFYQLFLMNPTREVHSRLTDGASRNSSALWSTNGSHLAFTSTRRNGRSNDVWLMDPSDTSAARIVFESPDGAWYGATDFSPDGANLLVAQYVSITDSRVHLVNLESGERRRIAGGDEETGSWLGVSPQFSADGERVFLATDLEADFRHLAVMNVETGERRILTGDLPWDVSALAMSEDRTRAAFVTNEDGVSEIYLLDPSSGRYRQVESIPQGIVFGLTFSPDGSQLAFSLNSPQTPSDVFTLALTEDVLDSGAMTRWTYSEVGGLDTDGFVPPELVHYPTFDSVAGAPRKIPAFVYTPAGPGPHPVIISIHGGPEGQYRPFFSSTFQVWLHQGAAVIAPNVRGSSGYGKTYVTLDNGYKREDSVKDIGALLDWIATRPDLDASRVAVIGGSYGGYMVLASAVHYSDRLSAAVDIVGISNFVTFLENTQDYRRDLRRVEYGDERDPAMRAHLERIANDPRVPASESEQIVRDVRETGREVWYMLAENEGHGFRKKENRDLYLDLVLLFFEKHLFDREGVS
jgi:dipeptidyl aminopeptidase/acylaminoacyl peptidase